MTDRHDVIVIGMGVGGEEVAGRLAGAGMKVVAVERKLVGGECPYWGCIPSKMMIRAGNSLGEAARVLGLAGQARIDPDWAPVAKRVREATANWNDEIAVERHEKKGETVVHGQARIVGPGEVEVDGQRFTASKGIVVATGGTPSIPSIDGLSEVEHWTNREAIETEELPLSLIVLGGGAIGVELAQVFHRFGTDVTIVEVAEHVLPQEEPENGRALGEALEAEGINILTSVSAQKIAGTSGKVTVTLSDGRAVDGERLLVATGRSLNISDIGLENYDLDPSARSIDVDKHLRAAPGLWAVGDVTGKGAFTHLGVYQGRLAAADILGTENPGADYSAIPRVTFSDPEVASVGLSEAQAREKGLDVKVGVAQTKSSARGWIHGPGAEFGVSKVIADTNEGVLVGGSTMGPAAGDVLGFLVLAIKEKIPIASLKELIYPYPTFVRGLEDALREI